MRVLFVIFLLYCQALSANDLGLFIDIGIGGGGDKFAANDSKVKFVDESGVTLVESDGQEISAGGGISTAVGIQYKFANYGLRTEYKYGRVKDRLEYQGGHAETSTYRQHLSLLKKFRPKHYLGLGLSRYSSPSIYKCNVNQCVGENIYSVNNGITLNYLFQLDNVRLGITHYPVEYVTEQGGIDATSTDFFLGWIF